jgi:hypothetical protein
MPHLRCFVCNRWVDLGGRGTGWAVSSSSSSSEASSTPEPSELFVPLQFFVHDSCVRKVAHPDFDFAAVAKARDETIERFRRMRAEDTPESQRRSQASG